MLKYAYLLPKISADTADNGLDFAEILPIVSPRMRRCRDDVAIAPVPDATPRVRDDVVIALAPDSAAHHQARAATRRA